MRLPSAAHESRPWRIREIAPDFALEDVWALPAHGGIEGFRTLLELMVSLDPANAGSLPLGVLWRLGDRLGSWFGLGRISAPIGRGRDDAAAKPPIPGTNETSLAGRLPDGLRDTAADPGFGWTPFVRLYRTGVGFAAELCPTGPCTPCCTWPGSTGAKAATEDRWPYTSSRAARSGRDTWR